MCDALYEIFGRATTTTMTAGAKGYYLGRPLNSFGHFRPHDKQNFRHPARRRAAHPPVPLAVLAPLPAASRPAPTRRRRRQTTEPRGQLRRRGDALKAAARDYEAQTGVRVQIAEFPTTTLFEKELIDLQAATGATTSSCSMTRGSRASPRRTISRPHAALEKKNYAARRRFRLDLARPLPRALRNGHSPRAPLRRQLAALLLPQRLLAKHGLKPPPPGTTCSRRRAR